MGTFANEEGGGVLFEEGTEVVFIFFNNHCEILHSNFFIQTKIKTVH